MRNYEHFVVDGEILLTDKRSLKHMNGTYVPEAYDSDDPRFLEEVQIDNGNLPPTLGFILGPVFQGLTIALDVDLKRNTQAVEAQGQDGSYYQTMIHTSKIHGKR